MLFRRRKPEPLLSRIRTLLWPRRSFSRSLLYIKKRVLRLHATPHAVAAGFAAGALSSFTPFVGFHFVIAFAIAYLIAGNMVAAALGTAVGNPLTFPFIWGGTYELGHLLLSGPAKDGPSPHALGEALMHMDFAPIWTPIVKPMLVGAVPLGLVAAITSYVIVFSSVRSFQGRRAIRLAALRDARLPRTAADDERSSQDT